MMDLSFQLITQNLVQPVLVYDLFGLFSANLFLFMRSKLYFVYEQKSFLRQENANIAYMT